MTRNQNCNQVDHSLEENSNNNASVLKQSSSSSLIKQKRPGRTRHGARNQHRHKHFCKWLLDTFPHLNDKNHHHFHVLDVAGGKGELAARLSMCHRLNVVMVDPREADVARCFESLVLPKLPNKWQRRFNEQSNKDPNFCRDVVDQRFRQLVTRFDQDTLENCTDLQDAVEQASLLVGMHSDGATEAIVDTALQHEKPFVVVPCCVFPNLFCERRVEENGKMVPVRSHEQFCRYLAQKDRRLVVETLPFEGRNTAIWWDPHQKERSSMGCVIDSTENPAPSEKLS